MPVAATYTQTMVVDGTTYTKQLISSGVTLVKVTPTVAAAPAGTLTTRTDANTGVATMESGHGILTADVVDVFWSGGSRTGMTATVASLAVTVDGGSGDDLPVLTTALRVKVPESVAFVVTGDNVTRLVINADVTGYVTIYDNAGTPVAVLAAEVGANDAYMWSASTGVTNPLASDVTTTARFSHGETTDKVMTLVAVVGTDA